MENNIEIEKLNAQLARCVDKLQDMLCGRFWSITDQIEKLLNSLPDSAKQDAEILRAAKDLVFGYIESGKDTGLYAIPSGRFQELVKAVRAREENK